MFNQQQSFYPYASAIALPARNAQATAINQSISITPTFVAVNSRNHTHNLNTNLSNEKPNSQRNDNRFIANEKDKQRQQSASEKLSKASDDWHSPSQVPSFKRPSTLLQENVNFPLSSSSQHNSPRYRAPVSRSDSSLSNYDKIEGSGNGPLPSYSGKQKDKFDDTEESDDDMDDDYDYKDPIDNGSGSNDPMVSRKKTDILDNKKHELIEKPPMEENPRQPFRPPAIIQTLSNATGHIEIQQMKPTTQTLSITSTPILTSTPVSVNTNIPTSHEIPKSKQNHSIKVDVDYDYEDGDEDDDDDDPEDTSVFEDNDLLGNIESSNNKTNNMPTSSGHMVKPSMKPIELISTEHGQNNSIQQSLHPNASTSYTHSIYSDMPAKVNFPSLQQSTSTTTTTVKPIVMSTSKSVFIDSTDVVDEGGEDEEDDEEEEEELDESEDMDYLDEESRQPITISTPPSNHRAQIATTSSPIRPFSPVISKYEPTTTSSIMTSPTTTTTATTIYLPTRIPQATTTIIPLVKTQTPSSRNNLITPVTTSSPPYRTTTQIFPIRVTSDPVMRDVSSKTIIGIGRVPDEFDESLTRQLYDKVVDVFRKTDGVIRTAINYVWSPNIDLSSSTFEPLFAKPMFFMFALGGAIMALVLTMMLVVYIVGYQIQPSDDDISIY